MHSETVGGGSVVATGLLVGVEDELLLEFGERRLALLDRP